MAYAQSCVLLEGSAATRNDRKTEWRRAESNGGQRTGQPVLGPSLTPSSWWRCGTPPRLRRCAEAPLAMGGEGLGRRCEPLTAEWPLMLLIGSSIWAGVSVSPSDVRRAADPGDVKVTWRLRMAAAERGVWTGVELCRLLAERAGLKLSAASISGLMSKQPSQGRLAAVCAVGVALR